MSKILMIIPYEFYPPTYGGALRGFYLMREMARCHQVTLLTVQPVTDFDFTDWQIAAENLKIVSTYDEKGYTTLFNVLPERWSNAINSRILRRSVFKRGNLYLLKTYPTLKKVLKQTNFDFICFENLECFSFLRDHAQMLSPQSKLIYNAHNVDSDLWMQHYKSSKLPDLLDYAEGALFQEKNLHKSTDLCFCCSDADKNKLMRLNENRLKAVVIPNGVDCEARPFDNNPRKYNYRNILFCGALDYAPNIEGIRWFHKYIFPIIKRKIPEIKLTVIGKMNKKSDFSELWEDNTVNFLGFVDDVVDYYKKSSILIVPLLKGSGTRLKILEAMSLGNPVVSTVIGAEGLELNNEKEILIAEEPIAFARAILTLFREPDLYETLRANARKLVEEKYDWKIIGDAIDLELNHY